MLVPVYDIVNCGPRHRFWANGKIIHNSGGCNVQNLPGNKPGQSTRLREAFIAPPGHKLVVCDLSAIECRVLAWLAGEEQILDIFRAKEDIYCDMASTVFQKLVAKADKDERQVGKQLILSCGYSMSWKKFQENMYLVFKTLFDTKMADKLGVSVGPMLSRHSRYISLAKPQTLTPEEFAVHCAVCEFLVKAYRDKYPKITAFWRTCIQSLEWMLNGEEIAIDPHGMITTFHTGVKAPWGHPLRYVELESKVKKNGKGIQWSRASKEGRSHLHPGLVAENCLTEESLILTGCGLKRIVDVAPSDEVFDGVEWVRHEGVIAKGRQEVFSFGGVGITADHRVEVDNGWVESRHTTWQVAASSCKRSYGAAIWDAASDRVLGRKRAGFHLEDTLRLWGRETDDCLRVSEAEGSFLRVQPGEVHGGESRDARHEQAPCVCGMAQHDRQMPSTDTQGIPAVRGAGSYSLPWLALKLLSVLGRHGTDLPARANLGAEGQQPGLQPRELRLGRPSSASAEHPHEPSDRYSEGADAPDRGLRADGDRRDNIGVPHRCGLAPSETVRPPSSWIAETYDLKNCGPRHRFCVYVPEAKGFIVVHNCTQWLARHVIAYQALQLQNEGLKIAFTCHDEIVGVSREEDAPYWERRMEQVMSEPISWLPGLPLAAESGSGYTYYEAK